MIRPETILDFQRAIDRFNAGKDTKMGEDVAALRARQPHLFDWIVSQFKLDVATQDMLLGVAIGAVLMVEEDLGADRREEDLDK